MAQVALHEADGCATVESVAGSCVTNPVRGHRLVMPAFRAAFLTTSNTARVLSRLFWIEMNTAW